MSSVVITIKSDDTQSYLQQLLQLDTNLKDQFINDLCRYLKSFGKIRKADIDVQTGSANPVAASNTLTLASVAADDTVTIGNVTLTAKASPSTEDEFDQSGTDAEDATDLAAKINAHSVLSQVVSASAASDVVTVTSRIKGVIGNQIALSQSGGTISIGGDGTALEGGTGGATEAATTYELGAS